MISHSMLGDDSYVVLPLAWCEDCEAYRPAAGASRQGWRCLVCRTLRDSLNAVVAAIHPDVDAGLERIRRETREELSHET